MLGFEDARKSWQRITKFQENLSFISTNSQLNLKSAWSPVTPSLDIHETDFAHMTEPPPVPPMPAALANHVRPIERERDEKRSIERARAQAAAALERGSAEREAERKKADAERSRRIRQQEQAYLEKKRQLDARGIDELEDMDMERAMTRSPPESQPSTSYASKAKSAFSRVSQAVIRFTTTPAPPSPSPFPRDTLPTHLHSGRHSQRSSGFGLNIPGRLSDLSPWPALNVRRNAAHGRSDSDAPIIMHQHYYSDSADAGRGHSRAASDDDRTFNDHYDVHDAKERSGLGGCKDCKKHKRQSRWWCILLFVLLLALIGNVVFLDIGSFKKTISSTQTPVVAPVVYTTTGSGGATVVRTSTSTASASGSTSSSAPAAITSCLSAFTSAPPSTYPCSQCIPILSAIPNDLSTSDPTSKSTVTGQGNVLQFCALRAINAALPSSSSSALTSVGWLKNTQMCTWPGVDCDGQGRVQSLTLNAPAVPSTIPQEMQYLVGLKTLSLTGDNNVPAGSFSPISTLTSLQTLVLANTALSGTLGDQTPLSALSQLTTLTLSSNQQLGISGTTLGGITNMGLTSLNLNTQSLPSNALAILSQSGNKLASTLSLLKLTSTGQSGQIPDGLAQTFTSLKTLVLDGNALTSMPDPATNNGIIFPSGVTTLSMTANPDLEGVLTSAECQALQQANAKSCVFTGTGVTLQTGLTSCGNCQLRRVAETEDTCCKG